MNRKRELLSVLVVSLLAMGLMMGMAFAQGAGKGEGATGAQTEGPKTIITGKIIHMKSYGGYVVISVKPHEEYKVINETEEVLGPWPSQAKPLPSKGAYPGEHFCSLLKKSMANNIKDQNNFCRTEGLISGLPVPRPGTRMVSHPHTFV